MIKCLVGYSNGVTTLMDEDPRLSILYLCTEAVSIGEASCNYALLNRLWNFDGLKLPPHIVHHGVADGNISKQIKKDQRSESPVYAQDACYSVKANGWTDQTVTNATLNLAASTGTQIMLSHQT